MGIRCFLHIFIVTLFTIHQGITQTTQNIKGIVIDKESEMPMISANVIVKNIEPILGVSTDLDGNFIIPDLPIGRYTIEISYLGYESILVPNIELVSGKEAFLEIGIVESLTTMDEVVILGKVEKDRAQNEMATVSARTFSVEEVNRFSGGRSDVGRLAANFAGVSTANDARNDIVIRGNSPTGVLWRLEGIPIPNPNHFSTLGTTGGPISALNPNMIKNSDFLTGAFPAEYGNVLAGVFDLGFRKGNRDQHEFMAQIGAVSGLELMAEGPINKKSQSSYLVTGRYSFLGLVGDFFPIGTNAIPNYRDVSFHLDFGNSKWGRLSIFGIGGQSDIDFLHNEVDETDLFAAVDEDLLARSKFGVLGAKHNLILNKKTYLRTILSGSFSGNSADIDRYSDVNTTEESVRRITEVDDQIIGTSFSTFLNRKFNSRLTMRAGFMVEINQNELSSRTREFTPNWYQNYKFDGNSVLFQSFAQSQYKFNKHWSMNLGIHTQRLNIGNTTVFEPRGSIQYKLDDKNVFSFGYGIHSQNAPLPILLATEQMEDGTLIDANKDLKPSRSQHFVLAYDSRLGANWRLKSEWYYQLIDQVPVDLEQSSFSLLNVGEGFIFPDDKFGLVNEGTGSNYGMEITLEKFFSQGFYGLITGSLYNSTYVGSDGIERSTAFNNRFVANALAGKEIKLGKQKRNAFTIDTKITTAQGRNYTPVNLEASLIAGEEVLSDDIAFSERFSPYFRWDVKIGMKLNSRKKKVSHHFYVDIQNITNRDNVFIRRYNRLTNEVNRVSQLGFFPDFMYRIQF